MNSNDTPEVRTVTDQGARNVLQLVKLRYATVLAKLAVFGFLFGTGLGFAGDVREEALRRDFARYYLTTGEYVTQLDDCFAQTAARSDCAAQIPVWTQLAYDEARQKNTFVRFTARRQYRLEVALGLTLLSAGLIVWLFNFELRYVLRGDLHEQLTEDLITLGMILETVAAENLTLDSDTEEFFAEVAKHYRRRSPLTKRHRELAGRLASLRDHHGHVRRLNAQWYT